MIDFSGTGSLDSGALLLFHNTYLLVVLFARFTTWIFYLSCSLSLLPSSDLIFSLSYLFSKKLLY